MCRNEYCLCCEGCVFSGAGKYLSSNNNGTCDVFFEMFLFNCMKVQKVDTYVNVNVDGKKFKFLYYRILLLKACIIEKLTTRTIKTIN